MPRVTFTIVLVVAVCAGPAATSAALLRLTGEANADRVATAPMRSPIRAVARTHQHAARNTPSTAKFARILTGASNQYGQEHSASERIRNVNCVQASPGHYMCSYAIVRPGAPSECHLIQARWTPHAASSVTVMLSGRTTRCRNLHDAIDSLG
jgi:hypothetical protein